MFYLFSLAYYIVINYGNNPPTKYIFSYAYFVYAYYNIIIIVYAYDDARVPR